MRKIICRLDDGAPSFFCDDPEIQVYVLNADAFSEEPYRASEAEVRPVKLLYGKGDTDFLAEFGDSQEVRESYEDAVAFLADKLPI